MTALDSWISLSEFARRDGCSEGSVRRGVKRGYLTLSADKRVDPALVGTGWRKSNRRLAGGLPVDPKTGAVKVDMALIDDPTLEARLARGDLTIAEADRVKMNALALKHLTAAGLEFGRLIKMEVADRVLFEAGRAQRDAWLNWPSRVAPFLAAEIGRPVERVLEVLNEAVYRQLLELSGSEEDLAV